MGVLDFLGTDILGFQLGQPGVQILAATSFPNILCDINGCLAAKGQCNGVTRSGVDGTRDSFVFQKDGRVVRAALDVREDGPFHFDTEVFAETLYEIMAHRSWRGRGVQGSSDGFTLRCSHPHHEMFRCAVGSGQHDDSGIRRRVFYNPIDRKLYQRFGRLRCVIHM